MISWTVEWWTEDGDVIEVEEYDDFDDVLYAVEKLSHKTGLYDTIAICVADKIEVDEEERWTTMD
jgi:hypothetical protein